MATFERIFFSVMNKLQAAGLVGKRARHSRCSRVSSVLAFLVILGVLACSYIRPARSSVGHSHFSALVG